MNSRMAARFFSPLEDLENMNNNISQKNKGQVMDNAPVNRDNVLQERDFSLNTLTKKAEKIFKRLNNPVNSQIPSPRYNYHAPQLSFQKTFPVGNIGMPVISVNGHHVSCNNFQVNGNNHLAQPANPLTSLDFFKKVVFRTLPFPSNISRELAVDIIRKIWFQSDPPTNMAYELQSKGNAPTKERRGYSQKQSYGSKEVETEDIAAKGEEREKTIRAFWENLYLLAETGQNIVEDRLDSLTSKSLHEVLKIAIDNVDMGVLKCCMTLGLPINDDTYFKMTPLTMAIDTDNPILVEAMIEYGADVNKRSLNADSPLHYCVEHKKMNAAEALIKAGKKHSINLDILGSDGFAPLHKAAKTHSKDMIILLIRHGANVNVKGENGCTPLHIAANCGPEPCTQLPGRA